jgi:hypothetical protein
MNDNNSPVRRNLRKMLTGAAFQNGSRSAQRRSWWLGIEYGAISLRQQ